MKSVCWKLGVLLGALGVFAVADAQLDFYDTNVVFTGSHTRPLAGQGSGAFISPDGKFAGFTTTRHGLKFGDIPQTTDVFLRSLTGGQTYGLNKFAGRYFPVESEYQHLAVMPSNQGLVNFFVVENPVAGLSTARTQIYVHNRETGETSVASVPPVGTASLGYCDPVAIDNLGTRLIFTGAKPQDQYGIYVRDFMTGVTTLVHEPIRGHRPVLGVSANGLNILYRDGSGLSLFKNGVKTPIFSASASVYTPHWVSDDGKTAILESTAALDPLDVGGNDLYVLNLETKVGVRLPRPTNTEVSLRAVHVSRNGRFIAVAPYSTVKSLVFDRTTNKWTDFTPYNVGQEFPESIAIDNSGNNVVMSTYYQNPMWLSRSSRVARYLDDVGQPNLPDDLQNFAVTPDERFAFVRSRDIFRDGVYRSVRRDMTTGGDVVVPNNPMPIAVSNNGRYVLGRPDSLAVHQHVDLKRGVITNLVGNPVGMDGSGNLVVFLANNQVWVRNISRGEEYLLSYTATGLGGNRPSGSAVISNDGRYVYFTSSARDLAAGRELPYEPEFDEVDKSLYRWDSQTRTTQLVLVPRGEDLTFDGVEGPQVSADGRFVAFTYLVSSADNFYFPMILDTQTGSWQKVPGGTTRILSISPDGQYALITDEFRLRVLRLGDGREGILLTDEFYGTTFSQGQMTNNRRVWFSLAGVLVRGRYEFR